MYYIVWRIYVYMIAVGSTLYSLRVVRTLLINLVYRKILSDFFDDNHIYMIIIVMQMRMNLFESRPTITYSCSCEICFYAVFEFA